MESRTSEAQKRASTKWNRENKEKMKKIRLKSSTKKYISLADKDDLKEVESFISARKKELRKE